MSVMSQEQTQEGKGCAQESDKMLSRAFPGVQTNRIQVAVSGTLGKRTKRLQRWAMRQPCFSDTRKGRALGKAGNLISADPGCLSLVPSLRSTPRHALSPNKSPAL